MICFGRLMKEYEQILEKETNLITLYTLQNDPRCEMAKRILDMRHVKYTVRVYEDLSEDAQNALLVRTEAANIYSFPVVEKEDGTLTTHLYGLEGSE